MIHDFATLLTSAQGERGHGASLEILSQVGLLVRNARAREVFGRHGARVDGESQIVRLPASVVEESRRKIPSTFPFYGRDPRFDKTMPADTPVIVTGSSAPTLTDPITGQERRARSDDLARIAHLVNELPGYDVFSISTLAEDAPPGLFT